jgi:membrane protease YdiL (CAAX protease family)
MTDDPRRRMPEDTYWTDWRGNSEARRSADEPFEDPAVDRGSWAEEESWAEASRVTEPDEESFVSPGRYDPDRWEPGPAHWHSADAQHDIDVTPVADPRSPVGLRGESEGPRLNGARGRREPVGDRPDDAVDRSAGPSASGARGDVRDARDARDAALPADPGRAMVRARRLLLVETLLVLALSLGQSAWYSILRMVERLTRGTPLSGQTSSLNTSVTPDRPWLDLTYQLSDIAFGVVPALLAVLLMSRISPPRGGVRRRLGLISPGWGQDVGSGLVIATFIGVPGLGLYVVSKELGFNTTVQAAGLHGAWWVVPVLILSAIMNAVLEETVMVGYLVTRWRQLGWNTALVVVLSALIRGTYHLYQGWGGFVGNIVMGAVLGLIYVRRGRLLPLIVAHAAIDVVAFLGYTFLVGRIPWLS